MSETKKPCEQEEILDSRLSEVAGGEGEGLKEDFGIPCPNCGSEDLTLLSKDFYWWYFQCNTCGTKFKTQNYV